MSLQQLKKMNRLMMGAGSEMRQAKRSRKLAIGSGAPCVLRNYRSIATRPPKAVTLNRSRIPTNGVFRAANGQMLNNKPPDRGESRLRSA
ncbi:hypothetical protein B0G82_7274 [Paraburkholderia sp. BL17N1]|nr:hypothetical protein B0G82_7274 [Paraburkholderia sp. BL17N1]